MPKTVQPIRHQLMSGVFWLAQAGLSIPLVVVGDEFDLLLDGASIEVDVADPEAAELDPTQAEPFGQRQRQLVEQRVASGSGELAEKRRLLSGVGAAARLGA